MFQSVLRGRVWIFGDNISTDLLMPGFAAMSNPDMSPQESARYCMYSNRPGWAEQVRPGDLIVAGRNFGCGSSRPGSKVLKTLGIGAVIAESAARIFFRNSINLGFPVVACPGVLDLFAEGEELEADLRTGVIRNLSTGKTIVGSPLPEGSPPMEILKAGGLLPLLERQRQASPTL
ncbi:MAG: 3-isopropylmalate dehydratase [Oscillibacter sp.]|nr:3-isopropylmalate dehydratase [Oscillibacter sp.]